MAVYVDSGKYPFRGMLMCHLLADSLDELHQMAEKIDMKRIWFQDHGTPHYDICQERRALAIKLGAIEIDRKKTVALIRMYRAQIELHT